ncbi:unnamed protein product [Rhizophagus irregularis]|nr:unnamed protein product [Rhizophagus irregularis]CAB5374191.1 unnamed protein product [Rhizophagus irregularis]
MSNEHQQIKLSNPPPKNWVPKNINFKKNGDLIISSKYEISIYHSKHDKMGNELSLVSSHELSSYNEDELLLLNKVLNRVFIDDDNIWVISPNYLFHWDLETFQISIEI